MRSLVVIVGLASLLTGCGSSVAREARTADRGDVRAALEAGSGAPRPRGGAARAAPKDAAGSSALPRPPDLPRVVLDRERTGEAEATIVVINDFPRRQHVFIDGRAMGTVSSGATGRFPLTAGAHTITSADSDDPDDNPSSLTELFETGYRYGYRIVAW